MTPDQEALKIATAWGCGGDSGAMAMVRAVLIAERERCAKIADDMRTKHGSPTGDAYSNGVWDQGVRIAAIIRNGVDG